MCDSPGIPPPGGATAVGAGRSDNGTGHSDDGTGRSDKLTLTAPMAPECPTSLSAHGDVRIDPWHWLRDAEDPEVIDLLEKENAYTWSVLGGLAPTHAELLAELRSRVAESDFTVPARKGEWWYYTRTFEGRSYAQHCRIRGDGTVPPELDPLRVGDDEQLLLDENHLATGHDYVAVGDLAISPSGRLLAYSVDTEGNERFSLYVKRIDAPSLQEDPGPVPIATGVSYGLEFGDERTIYFVRADEQNRPYRIVRKMLTVEPGTAREITEEVLYDEPDERFFAGISKTLDEQYLFVEIHSKQTSEVMALRLLPDVEAGTPELPAAGPPRGPALFTLVPRREGIEYTVAHCNGWFLVLTNDDAPDFRLIAGPAPASPGYGPEAASIEWTEVLPHRPGTRLEHVEVIGHHAALQLRRKGTPTLVAVPLGFTRGNGDASRHAPRSDPRPPDASASLDPGPSKSSDGSASHRPSRPKPLDLAASLRPVEPEPLSTCRIGLNLDEGATSLRYTASNLRTPLHTYDLDLATGTAHLRKIQPVPGGYDPDLFETARLAAISNDGTEIPISIVHPRDFERDGTQPCLLYGYGAYEYSIDPLFSPLRLPLLDRGFSFAIAHVRGGGEKGRRWYEEGRLAAKTNTFHDFIACARHLISERWTSPEKLVARGGSAGGMLMGAAANIAPELFRAVVAEVPFVDCLTTMMDPSLPLTITEWEEWGDPLHDPEAYYRMKLYSPYDNIRTGAAYPDILATAGLSDPRVGFFEPAKWVQRLRRSSPHSRVLLLVNMEAGHAGPSGRYGAWKEEAAILSFVIDAVTRPRRTR